MKTGDTIDFVVDSRTNVTWDAFAWSPVVRLTRPPLIATAGNEGVTEWNAATEFAGPASAAALSPWRSTRRSCSSRTSSRSWTEFSCRPRLV